MINWNKAPKDATHHGKFENHECWYQVKDNEVFSWNTGACNDTHFWHDTFWKSEQLTANNEGNVTFTPRPEVKPVYTQEMHEAGELPSVGMEFTLSYYEKDSRFNDFNGKEVKVLSVSECGVYTFKSPLLGFGALRLTIEHVKPLTPPVELVDGKAYQFDYDGSSAVGFAFEGATFVSRKDGECQGANMSDCTNIQPLTVEK